MRLGQFPTPVLKQQFNERTSFWVKNDGASSKIYGGNKVRKLEYLFPFVKGVNKTRLVIIGGNMSHTTLACALHAPSAGLDVTAVVYPPPESKNSGEVDPRLLKSEAEVIKRGSYLTTMITAKLLARRSGSFFVPLGISMPITTLGHIKAGLELYEQVKAGLLPEPEVICIAHASGGTLAGLLIALALIDSKCGILAVQTVEKIISGKRRLKVLLKNTINILGAPEYLNRSALSRLILLEDRYLGKGYFSRSREADLVQKRISNESVKLDPVFTAKAMAAMVYAMEESPDKNYLFWNTHNDGAQ